MGESDLQSDLKPLSPKTIRLMALPASMRLRGSRCFNQLHRAGTRHHGYFMVLRLSQGEVKLLKPELRSPPSRCCRCALVISSKVSKRAVQRNRLRRLLHQHLVERLMFRPDLAGKWLLISLRPHASQAKPVQLIKECDVLLQKSGVIW